MRKVKKLLTLVMAITMMFAMSLTAFATETGGNSQAGAKIEVKGAEGAVLTYAQVIKADPTKKTGWAFTDSQYESLFANYGTDEQSMIQGWIDASSDSEQARLDNLGSVSTSTSFTPNPMPVTAPGLYVIKGQDPADAEIKCSYSTMLAYVSFADIEAGNTITVICKREPKTPKKKLTNAADDTYVEIGTVVSYDVQATVPYMPQNGSAALVIQDELSGGIFKLNDNGKVDISVKLANENTARSLEIDPVDSTHIEIDFNTLMPDLITEANTYANVELVVTYAAIVDGTSNIIDNKATINNNGNPSEVKSYTGKLMITKIDGNTEELLDGAEFIITNGTDFALLKTVNGEYVLDGWTSDDKKATHLTTVDGVATAAGFDKNVTYYFREVKAPEGYSLNTDDEEAIWEGEDEALIAKAFMSDTKLSKLPYTGGKGTAAFTGFGVLLMSVAAGLYFANKKNRSVK